MLTERAMAWHEVRWGSGPSQRLSQQSADVAPQLLVVAGRSVLRSLGPRGSSRLANAALASAVHSWRAPVRCDCHFPRIAMMAASPARRSAVRWDVGA